MKHSARKKSAARRSAAAWNSGDEARVQEVPTGAILACPQTGKIIGQIVAQTLSSSKIIGAVQSGLAIGEMESLRSLLGLPLDGLALKLGISKATLHRRKAAGRLDPAESDRVVRFARLMGRAVEVLESSENARKWLASPQIGLGGAVPLDYAETEVGAREVEDLLGRIEYGVYA
jgi:putative toxin-antitoxin system antitoxin component (TIGR02293 family)